VQDAAEAAKNAIASPKATAAPVAAPVSAPVANGDVQSALSKQFDSLYQRLDADKRVTEAAGAARQDAMLRLVSSTLTENVEQSLSRIITASIDKEVIPAMTDMTSKIIDRKLAELLPQQLGAATQREIKAALPNALQQALKDQQVHRAISEMTANQIAQKVQQQVSSMLQQSLPNMATQATQKMVADLEARTNQRMREAEAQRLQDNAKIEHLSNMVRSLSQTIGNMADSQQAFQEQMLQMQQQSKEKDTTPLSDVESVHAATEPADPQMTVEEEEVQGITQMLMGGDYEAATIQVRIRLQIQSRNRSC